MKNKTLQHFWRMALILILVSISLGQDAPIKRVCATADRYSAELKKDQVFRNARLKLFAFTNAYKQMRSASRFAVRTGIITIPVVVHVLYNAEADNISDQQIASQIDVLNKDYQLQNPDLSNVPQPFKQFVGNPRIGFKLAALDPEGHTTSGVTRTKTTVAAFDYKGENADNIKFAAKGGHDAWPADKYLNLWVGRLRPPVLGYASFPGEPAQVDGVVITTFAFGTSGTAKDPFNKGRTATHEIGHWLNLFHIWGDDDGACTGSDQVDDTPNQADANSSKPHFPTISCNNGPNGDMFMNYMDYVDDDSMFMFTKGQVLRMEATLNGPRSAISESSTAGPK